MGLFDFFRRDAGAKVSPSDTPTPDDLKKHLTETGLDPAAYTIQVSGDTATVTGTANSQEEKEKIVLALGNVQGIGKVEDQITVPTSGTSGAPVEAGGPGTGGSGGLGSQFYTVQSGDTLSKIAKQFYGDANKYPAIFEANKPMLKDPDKIYPGQALRIPKAT